MMINDLDGRPAYYQYCRIPGTRCNAIMAMIDRGMSDEQIAEAVKRLPHVKGCNPNSDCDAETISVYRKAHDNKLCRIRTKYGFHSEDISLRNAVVLMAHQKGIPLNMIAETLKLSYEAVRHIVSDSRKPRRR